MGDVDVEKVLERIKKEQVVEEHLVRQICDCVQQVLLAESNMVEVSSPVTLVGDIHGQFYDVIKLMNLGKPPNTKYVFLGDYVDRGYSSVETIMLLFCLKILYPRHVFLLRGNHECRGVSSHYGFYDQVNSRYGGHTLWKTFNNTFDFLPIAAIVDNHIFCVHGGLSPQISALDQIKLINRQQEIPTEGPFCDLMWSDPEEIEGWGACPRGAGLLFGYDIVNHFNYHNGLSLIVRAHQLAVEGYKYHFDKSNLLTVWSAPNYCGRCGNLGSFSKVKQGAQLEFVTFKEDTKSKECLYYRDIIPYFL